MRINRLLRVYAYFKRGHSSYFAFLLSMVNFLSIQILLNNLALAILFIILYGFLCAAIGYYDYRKGLAPIETGLLARANPWMRDVAAALYYMSNGEKEKARKALQRWLE